MTTISAPTIPSLVSERVNFLAMPRSRRIAEVIAGTLILSVAIFLRVWNIGAIFASSDQAAMPYMVQHSYGLRWVFAHDYGPTLPLMELIWCKMLGIVGAPIGEAAFRTPIVFISILQLGMTWLLMERLHFGAAARWAGVAVCALLPPLVTDAHYPWAYHTVWLFFGTISLWATLAWMDDRRNWQLALAAITLCLHCLSNVYALALPVTLMCLWCWYLRESLEASRMPPIEPEAQVKDPPGWTRGSRDNPSLARRAPLANELGIALVGFVLPCTVALGVIFLSWRWTNQGQIGRLLLKSSTGSSGLHGHQILLLPGVLFTQIGMIYGVVCIITVLMAIGGLRTRDRRSLPAIWAIASVVPFTLLADWSTIGYARHYLLESVYAASMLGAAGLVGLASKSELGKWIAATVALFAAAQMGLGSFNVASPNAQCARLSGVETGCGNVREDTGIKAAGHYVRTSIPADAIVLCLHTRDGMELPVAEYYCGRRVLAHYDLRDAMLGPLWQRIRDRVDVVIAEPAQAEWIEASGWKRICTLRSDGRVVRQVFTRPDSACAFCDSEIGPMNRLYDGRFIPRHVPTPLPAAQHFLPALAEYHKVIAELKATRSAGS